MYMLRAGLFDDVDAVAAWRAGDRNAVNAASSLANVSAKVRFRGVSAHAAAVWNVLPNQYLASVMHPHLEHVGGYEYTPGERAFAETLRQSLEGPLPAIDQSNQVLPPQAGVGSASTDMGDVSWRVPTVQLTAATWVPGTPAHSWQAVASGGTSIGTKGMMIAAKTMALTAVDLFTNPAHIQKGRAEFDKARGPDFKYSTRLADRKPALDYRK